MILDLFRNPGDPEPQPPEVGDVILTVRLAKVVTGVRPVESKVWHHRWRVDTRTIGPRSSNQVVHEVRLRKRGGAGVRIVETYQRGEGAIDFARKVGAQVETG